MLTAKELAEKYKVSVATVYNWMGKGVPSYKQGGTRRFDEKEVEEWFKGSKEMK